MPFPVEISFHNMDRSEALATDIGEKANQLGEFFDRIVRCRIAVEAPHRRHHQGNLYRVRIQLYVPQRELIADCDSHDKQQHEDPYVAVRDAFDAIRRQLKEYVRELRGETKTHAVSPHGRIAKICLPEGPDFPERGYGFISTRDGREVYFHANSLTDVEFLQLEMGSEVRFTEELSDKGPRATSVRLAGRHNHLP